jgi:ornithine carrier protein
MFDALQEIGCGTIAGSVGKLVDFPFDTIKTRLQDSNSTYKSTIDCIVRTARGEGFWGFYSGIASPIAGAAFENAAAFLLYGRATSFLMHTYYPNWDEAANPAGKPLLVVSGAGAVAGFGTGAVLTPVELIKSRVQVNPKKYPDVSSAFRITVKEEGPSALFKGVKPTLTREVPGNACWFLFYELTLRNVFMTNGRKRADCPWYAFCASGGVGGVFYWSVLYPADTIKTRMQTEERFSKMGMRKTGEHLLKEGGVRALYKGFGITLCRAPPANATIFGMYELSSRTCKSWFGNSEK